MERYGMMTVERYIREGLPEGIAAFFEHQGKAVKLGFISSKDGILHMHRRGNCLALKVRGCLETPLYLSDLNLSGTDIEDVKKFTRIAPRANGQSVLQTVRLDHAEAQATGVGQFHG